MKRTPTAVLTLALFCATSAVAAESYEIHIERPSKVGEKLDINASGTEKRQSVVTVSGRRVNQEVQTLEGSLDARVTVLAVTNGQPSKVRIEVRSMSVKKNGKDTPALPKGAVVTGSRDDQGQELYEIEKGDLSEPAHDVLKLLVALADGNDVNDGDIIDAKGKKQIGDTWPINSQAAAKDISEGVLKIDPKSVKGQTTFDAVETVEGEECTRISSKMAGKVGKGKLPNGAQLQAAQFDGKLVLWVPTDRALPIRKGNMTFEMRMQMFVEQPGRPRLDINVTGGGSIARTIMPVK